MNFYAFLIKQYRPQIFTAILMVGITIWAFMKNSAHQAISWFEPIIGVATFIFAFFLWLNSLKKDWEESLPKRLTVEYEFGGRNIMVCYDSLLTNLADARTWALQIGKQMSDCEKLRFAPFYNFQDRGIQTHKNGQKYKSYVLTYYLSELPMPDKVSEEKKNNFLFKVENGCIEWYPEYNHDNTINIVEGYKPKANTSKIKITEA